MKATLSCSLWRIQRRDNWQLTPPCQGKLQVCGTRWNHENIRRGNKLKAADHTSNSGEESPSLSYPALLHHRKSQSEFLRSAD
ncbi:hypothetical protein MRB53_019068 [Persea americana]|uniref:Uncharacterized protein n=1 Tax=Persea americana TaxID=3435 RepID=A0ACC2MAL9_PERAE|nr:hypothetical protein MRB53_019068 [Persea americana]